MGVARLSWSATGCEQPTHPSGRPDSPRKRSLRPHGCPLADGAGASWCRYVRAGLPSAKPVPAHDMGVRHGVSSLNEAYPRLATFCVRRRPREAAHGCREADLLQAFGREPLERSSTVSACWASSSQPRAPAATAGTTAPAVVRRAGCRGKAVPSVERTACLGRGRLIIRDTDRVSTQEQICSFSRVMFRGL